MRTNFRRISTGLLIASVVVMVLVLFSFGCKNAFNMLENVQEEVRHATSDRFSLTVSSDGNGTVDPDGKQTLDDGIEYTVTGMPDDGFRFDTWEKTGGEGTVTFGAAGASTTTVSLTGGDASIIACFIDSLSPEVLEASPSDRAVSIATNSSLSVSFSEAIDPDAVTTDVFSLADSGGTAMAVELEYDVENSAVTIDPTTDLDPLTDYTATVTTGVTDMAGNALSEPFTWSFTTGEGADETPPTVIQNSPTGDEASTSGNVTVKFSESMDGSTIDTSTFTLSSGDSPLSGVVTYNTATRIATFNPDSVLANGTAYDVMVSGEITDLAGNGMGTNYSWSFTTETESIPPTVTSVSPTDGATGQVINVTVSVTFSKEIDPATVTVDSFYLAKNGAAGNVAGTVSADDSNTMATFTPSSNLDADSPYTATVTTAVTDLGGLSLTETNSWSFTTGSVSDESPPVVNSFTVNGGENIIDGVQYVNDPDLTITMDVTDEGSLIFMKVSADGTWPEWQVFNSPIQRSMSANDGEKTVLYQFKDDSDNWTEPLSYYMYLDTTPPSPPPITSGPDPVTEDDTPTWEWTNSDDAAAFRVNIDGEEWIELGDVSTYTADSLTETTHTFYLQASDFLGNWCDSVTMDFEVDSPIAIVYGSDSYGLDDIIYDVGGIANLTTTNLTFQIQNIGDETITLNGSPKVSLSGAGVGMYTVSNYPDDEIPSGSTSIEDLIISFRPYAGDTQCILSISYQDSDAVDRTFSCELDGASYSSVITVGEVGSGACYWHDGTYVSLTSLTDSSAQDLLVNPSDHGLYIVGYADDNKVSKTRAIIWENGDSEWLDDTSAPSEAYSISVGDGYLWVSGVYNGYPCYWQVDPDKMTNITRTDIDTKKTGIMYATDTNYYRGDEYYFFGGEVSSNGYYVYYDENQNKTSYPFSSYSYPNDSLVMAMDSYYNTVTKHMDVWMAGTYDHTTYGFIPVVWKYDGNDISDEAWNMYSGEFFDIQVIDDSTFFAALIYDGVAMYLKNDFTSDNGTSLDGYTSGSAAYGLHVIGINSYICGNDYDGYPCYWTHKNTDMNNTPTKHSLGGSTGKAMKILYY